MKRKAANLPPGSLVEALLDGRWRPCLLARRQGKDFQTLHLAPLDPPGELLPVDPETKLNPLPGQLHLEPTPATGQEPGPPIPTGGAFSAPDGQWLKTEEDYKGQRSLACVNLATGTIARRRDRQPEITPLTLTPPTRRWTWRRR
ncbi:hypothetical protein [Roseospirillum parvum]|uniref:Uncharacterized protein n=1 Tax=Roseospirillum parvum TaxID=83401 RepID=A0A1G7TN90_9PROT|nr:hypothetical protein [Roseospirillum parvum]SDG36484.1 hypothetical protein SAMN05421742_10145 [Roseospirillum parvum]